MAFNSAYLDALAMLETAGGKKTIKGPNGEDSHNLFNIKDNSGAGYRAHDKAEGSRDAYRVYANHDESKRDVMSLLERKYPNALKAETPEQFASALKAGGYATDPDYESKLVSVINRVQGRSARGVQRNLPQADRVRFMSEDEPHASVPTVDPNFFANALKAMKTPKPTDTDPYADMSPQEKAAKVVGYRSTFDTSPSVPAGRSTFGEGLGAAWSLNSPLAQHMGPLKASDSEYLNDPNFDFKTVDPTGSYATLLPRARNAEHARDLMREADLEKEQREIYENQSFLTKFAQGALVEVANPVNYVPGIGAVNVAKGAGLAAKVAAGALAGAGSAQVTESILQAQQTARPEDNGTAALSGALFGGALGAVGHGISSAWAEGGETLIKRDLMESLDKAYPNGRVNLSAAKNTTGTEFRSMEGSKVAGIPESVVKFALWGKYSRSTNQHAMTSPLLTVRNGVARLVRQSLATMDNMRGVGNDVPVETAMRQYAGKRVNEFVDGMADSVAMWEKNVQNGAYKRDDIIAGLQRFDHTIKSDMDINGQTFGKLMHAYIADPDAKLFRDMPEVVAAVERNQKAMGRIGEDLIDLNLIDKDKLVDIATGERLHDPARGVEARELQLFKKERNELREEIAELKRTKASKKVIKEEESKLAKQDAAIEAKNAEIAAKTEAYYSVIPSSKTHTIADSERYVHFVYDTQKIMDNPGAFEAHLVQKWTERIGEVDDPVQLSYDLQHAARDVQNLLTGNGDVLTTAELSRQLDLKSGYLKDRTINLEHSDVLPYLHQDVISSQLRYIANVAVDIEGARAGIKFADLINDVRDEFKRMTLDNNLRFGEGSEKALKANRELEAAKLMGEQQIKYIERSLKGKSSAENNIEMGNVEHWIKRANDYAAMVQLGGSAYPNSVFGDWQSMSRVLGGTRAAKLIAMQMDRSIADDLGKETKKFGTFSEFMQSEIEHLHFDDTINKPINPNEGTRNGALQKLDNGLGWARNKFAQYSGINIQARVNRRAATVGAAQHIMEVSLKGWDNLSATTRGDLAKFYIGKDMLPRIAKMVQAHADDIEEGSFRFANVEKWTDREAARAFESSVYDHTQYMLNLPSIGSGSSFMRETIQGRWINRYMAFNQSAHESLTLASLQNRDASRLALGLMQYTFASTMTFLAAQALSGKMKSYNPADIVDQYLGDNEKFASTLGGIVMRGGWASIAIDKVNSANKLLSAKKVLTAENPVADVYNEAIGEVGRKAFGSAKREDVTAEGVLLGPTGGAVFGLGAAFGSVIDGDWEQGDATKIRRAIPGQNIFWTRQGFDRLEEMGGGRPADRSK